MNDGEQVKCQCGVRPAAECAGAWESGCDLGTAGETVAEVITAARTESAESEEMGFVRMPRSANEAETMVNLGRMWLEVNAPDRIKPGAPVDGRPVAWVRFCSDGTIEGPIMDSAIEDVRRKSGAWTPLGVMGTGPQDTAAPQQSKPVARVAEVHMSRYTLEWTNGPLPEGTPLFVWPMAAQCDSTDPTAIRPDAQCKNLNCIVMGECSRKPAAAPQPAQEPIGFMSPKQVPRIVDPDDESAPYIPMRKTPKGNFTLALYAAPTQAASTTGMGTDKPRDDSPTASSVSVLMDAITPTQAAPAPADMVMVPLRVCEDAYDAIGHFVSDLGWADEDMQAMDNLHAYIARHKANVAAGIDGAPAPTPAPQAQPIEPARLITLLKEAEASLLRFKPDCGSTQRDWTTLERITDTIKAMEGNRA